MDPKVFANASAFPWVSNGGVHEHQVCEGGLTKRELAAIEIMARIVGTDWTNTRFYAAHAGRAVLAADALLAELAKP